MGLSGMIRMLAMDGTTLGRPVCRKMAMGAMPLEIQGKFPVDA
jgi:hypothetical protein